MIVYLDTNCVIYLIEQNPEWGPKVISRLFELRLAGHQVATSDLSRTECLVQPYLTANVELVADYLAFFSSPQVLMLPLTAAVCDRAAQLRAASGLKLKVPDCLHLAAAIEYQCERFLTNDGELAVCPAIPIEILS
jgi:predicted nucleic acid-binding protein